MVFTFNIQSTLSLSFVFKFDQFQIYDPKTARYEVPLNTPVVTKATNKSMYTVNVSKASEQFTFSVIRKNNSVQM